MTYMTPTQLKDRQRKFLRGVFNRRCTGSSISADECVQQAWRDVFMQKVNWSNPFYSENAPKGSKNRRELQNFAKGKIMEIAEKVHKPSGYVCAVKSAAVDVLAECKVGVNHIGHILELRDAVTNRHKTNMADGKLTFGRAQKLLNMCLKYMWCTKRVQGTPPHCPFDNIIINKVGLPCQHDPIWDELGGLENLTQQHEGIWAWTKSDNEEHYLTWLAAAEMLRRRNKIYASLSEWELFVFPDGDGKNCLDKNLQC